MNAEKFSEIEIADIVRYKLGGTIFIRRVRAVNEDEGTVEVFDDSHRNVISYTELDDEIVHPGEFVRLYGNGHEGRVISVNNCSAVG